MKTAEEVLTALLNVQLKPGGTLKKDLVNAKLAKDEQIKILTEWGKELCEEQREICAEKYGNKEHVRNAPLPTILKG